MVIHVADALQLIRMPVVMRTAINTDQENCHVRPRQPEQVQLELVHVCCFAVEEEQEAQHGGFGTGLPAVYLRVVSLRGFSVCVGGQAYGMVDG